MKEPSPITIQFMKETGDKIQKMELNLNSISKDTSFTRELLEKNIEASERRLSDLEKDKLNKEQFYFWRAILISGILLSIFLGIIFMLVEKT